MRKLKFLLGALAVAGGTSLLSSCFSDPTSGEAPSVTAPSVETNYTIRVNTNADKLTYNGKVTEKTFTTKESGALVLSKDGYVSQTVNIVLGENKDIVINVELIAVPTSDVSVADANETAGDTKIDGNRSSSILIPGDVQTTGVEDDAKFGIGIYDVVAVASEPVVVEDKVENDEPHGVCVAVCEPDGAVFSEPVTISVEAQNASGLSFQCTNGSDHAQEITVGANTVSAQVMHFSEWTFSLMARVVDIQTEEEVLFDGDILIHTGNNTFNYTAKTGVDSDRKGIVETFLISQYGSKLETVSKTGTLASTGEGSAHIRVVQTKKIVTYKSANTQFKATVYGEIKVEVISTTFDTSKHSGGTGGN